jgi:uncharacterized heparinase superfamily protein
MLKKASLIFNTVQHLKPSQLFFQLWYRLKNSRWKKYQYNSLSATRLHALKTTTIGLIPASGKYQGNNHFVFLNLAHQFPEKIDWNWNGHGKLWNYNLQYFDYLHDDRVADEEKQALILDFSTAYLAKRIPPEPYPVSLRLINWALYYSRSEFQSTLFEEAIRQQADYLQHNLEFHIRANHLLENYFALVVAGLALKEPALFGKGCKGMMAELDEQVLSDGAHYECSPMYHQIILSKLILVTDLLQNNPGPGTDLTLLASIAARMLGWMEAFAFSDLCFALVNDATIQIAPDAAVLLAAGARLGIQPSAVTLGVSGYRRWTYDNLEVLIDAGEIMPAYQPGHVHSDMLQCCLNKDGSPVLVDTGISTYQTNARRQVERQTRSHNTVTIQGADQSQVWGSFRVGARAKLTLLEDTGTLVRAKHNGYLGRFGVEHERQFRQIRRGILIKDILHGKPSVVACAHFHFDHSLQIKQSGLNEITTGNGLVLIFKGAEALDITDYEQAVGYNRLVVAKKVTATFTGSLETTIQQL